MWKQPFLIQTVCYTFYLHWWLLYTCNNVPSKLGDLWQQQGAAFLDEHKDTSPIAPRDPEILVEVSGKEPRLRVAAGEGELERRSAWDCLHHRGSGVLDRGDQALEWRQVNLLPQDLDILRQHYRVRQLWSPDDPLLELDLDWEQNRFRGVTIESRGIDVQYKNRWIARFGPYGRANRSRTRILMKIYRCSIQRSLTVESSSNQCCP